MICQENAGPDWQEGRLSPQEWHRASHAPAEAFAYLRSVPRGLEPGLDPQTILSDELFAKLSERCRLALLSNTVPLHVEALESASRLAAISRYASIPAAWAPANLPPPSTGQPSNG